MTSLRKTLHPLQTAAGDKENLVGPGRMLSNIDNLKGNLREVNENDKTPDQSKLIKRKKTTGKAIQAGKEKSSTVTAEDLTSDAVSEKYWENLAEQRRIALEATLKDNKELVELNENLHKRVELLEEENAVLKEQLAQSDTLVDTLKEMIYNDTADESSIIDNSYEV